MNGSFNRVEKFKSDRRNARAEMKKSNYDGKKKNKPQRIKRTEYAEEF